MQEIFLLEDLLDVLIDIEVMGQGHYKDLANKAGEEKLTELFMALAKQEEAHEKLYKSLKEQYVNYTTSDVDEEYRAYLEALINDNIDFMTQKKEVMNLEEAFDLAFRLEKDTILFLREAQKHLPEVEHDKIEGLVAQEQSHIVMLRQYRSQMI
ncbi:ferritin-like domain-containing protein [Petrocella sp. FN5]|uniref:ferritin-like domain-containing protein n=1 Tax=Petrocella sp. FN5 TaxID=3032002 RepID=UPI0023DC56C0|nr:ferritin family protein [Petrocella sp. FN5]MDF1617635.1 ferritin family protein [Petrocella sp. FN5]